ncbi:MAG TPA: phosphate ABC transporter permease subunit PstC [Ktedonobacteraceae bacterium]
MVQGQSRLADRIAQTIFFICAILLVVIITGVIVFIATSGIRIFFEHGGAGIKQFFTSTIWDPTGSDHSDAAGNPVPYYGALGLIIGSVITTLLAVIIATPLSFAVALFFTELSPRWMAGILQPLIEIFTGMPSIVIGFLGLITLVPLLAKAVAPITGGLATAGYGWGAATIVLIVMIMPTIISVAIDTLRAVPISVREASLALGSTRWQTMWRAVLPAASAGLGTAVVLGMARAIGEAIAVALVLGGAGFPTKGFSSITIFFQPNVNITQAIVNEFGDTTGVARDAYFTLALVLLVISFLFICISRYLASRSVYR